MGKYTFGLLLAALASIAPPANGATTVELELDDVAAFATAGGNPPASRHRPMSIVLEARSFVVRSADETWLFAGHPEFFDPAR